MLYGQGYKLSMSRDFESVKSLKRAAGLAFVISAACVTLATIPLTPAFAVYGGGTYSSQAYQTDQTTTNGTSTTQNSTTSQNPAGATQQSGATPVGGVQTNGGQTNPSPSVPNNSSNERATQPEVAGGLGAKSASEATNPANLSGYVPVFIGLVGTGGGLVIAAAVRHHRRRNTNKLR